MNAKPDRLPPIPPDQWTGQQRQYAQEVIDGPRGALISPFVPLLRSPELMAHAQRMGEYLRYRSVLGLRLSELAILITARQWSQKVEWAIHAPIAAREGVAASTIDAIAEGREPKGLPEDEAVLYAFSMELHQNRSISDATWSDAVRLFGEQGAVDLIGINGYYTFLSMVMNAARTEVPRSEAPPLPTMPDV
jgi:4-carboxymuconolactone decarboxylase